ncbi:MAG: hypothetical protein H6760_04575 [Candidatus Nomurabacteria bacterium]|nr:MAG: hypothetical protein H6760_04575 [Candidatus Nomurabacteria bacterium]
MSSLLQNPVLFFLAILGAGAIVLGAMLIANRRGKREFPAYVPKPRPKLVQKMDEPKIVSSGDEVADDKSTA